MAAVRLMHMTAVNLACSRGEREVWAGLNFSLAGGEALLVTGPNGAGKSTLLRLLAGLLHASGGSLALTGGDSDASLPEQAHYLGHRDAVKPSLTVAENLGFWSAFLGGGRSPVEAALEAVGLAALAGLPAGYLSAGQRRRLSIARLVAVRRKIWLLDEPTSALDGAAQGQLARLMRDHLALGGLIVAAAHGPIGLENARELRLGPAHSGAA